MTETKDIETLEKVYGLLTQKGLNSLLNLQKIFIKKLPDFCECEG